MKLCKSAVYKHFKLLPSILIKKGVVKYKFICKTNAYISFWKISIDWLIFFLSNEDPVTCVCHNHSTSNLNCHIKRCSGKLAPAAQHISKFAHRSTYNKAKFRYLITLWVSQCHHPFSIVSNPLLQQILRMLYTKVNVPSPSTVSRDVKEAFEIAKKHVGAVLQVHDLYHLKQM